MSDAPSMLIKIQYVSLDVLHNKGIKEYIILVATFATFRL